MVLASPVGDYTSELYPSEKLLVKSAVVKRKAEFSTGRVLAARALRMLELPEQPIHRGSKNEPLWPAGVVGSITHTSETCIVAMARDHVCNGIGVDIEKSDADVSDLAHLIVRPDEFERSFDRIDGNHDDVVRLTFSAKESIFKSIFPHLGRFIEFEEVGLEIDDKRQSFTATSPDDSKLDKLVRSGRGGYFWFDDCIVTNFILPKHGDGRDALNTQMRP